MYCSVCFFGVESNGCWESWSSNTLSFFIICVIFLSLEWYVITNGTPQPACLLPTFNLWPNLTFPFVNQSSVSSIPSLKTMISYSAHVYQSLLHTYKYCLISKFDYKWWSFLYDLDVKNYNGVLITICTRSV